MFRSAVGERYDRLARSYDERWRAYLSGTLGPLRDQLGLSGDERVLDVACGTGELERLLLAEYPDLRLVGVDISESMLSVAREKLAGRADFVHGRAEELPFENESFDVAVTANSFHYFEDPTASLREMRRVLRPGGAAVVMDWCRDFLACRLCDVMLKMVDPAHSPCYGQRELREMMLSAGFDVTVESRVRPYLLWGTMTTRGVRPTDGSR